MKNFLVIFAIAFSVAVFSYNVTFADSDEKQCVGEECKKKGCDKEKRHGKYGGRGHGGGQGGWLGGEGVDVSVKETKNGIVITYSSKDKDKVKELHLKGEMIKIKNELKELKK